MNESQDPCLFELIFMVLPFCFSVFCVLSALAISGIRDMIRERDDIC